VDLLLLSLQHLGPLHLCAVKSEYEESVPGRASASGEGLNWRAGRQAVGQQASIQPLRCRVLSHPRLLEKHPASHFPPAWAGI
jgi:hypothetical protein